VSPLNFPKVFRFLFIISTRMAQMMCDCPLGHLNRARCKGQCCTGDAETAMEGAGMGDVAALCNRNVLQCSNTGAVPARLLVNLQPSTTHLIKSLLLQL